jgi:hypothetical protein
MHTPTTEFEIALHQTTTKGNDEGRSHPNAHYNRNILRKLYNKINYGAGLTSTYHNFRAIFPWII